MYHNYNKVWAGMILTLGVSIAGAQTVYDTKTLVDTNNASTTTVTSTNTNTNTSTSTATSTNTNNNNNTSTSTSTSTNTNTNINTGDSTVRNVITGDQTVRNVISGDQTVRNVNTGDMTNRNINTGDMTNRNINSSTVDATNRNIQSGDMTNRNINDTRMRVEQPPPTAIAPAMMSGGNNDLCTTGTSGAVQTQILGVSSGGTVRDLNCERLKNAKTLYDMGMKVAAVATLCQDRRVFDAMWHAGTPCPYEGQIGEQARVAWNANPDRIPKPEEPQRDDFYKKMGFGALIGALLFKLF